MFRSGNEKSYLRVPLAQPNAGQTSQGSRIVSSTPNRSPAYSLSPSISIIDGSQGSDHEKEDDVSDTRRSSIGHISVTTGISDAELRDSQTTCPTKKTVKFEGVFKHLKPKNSDGLYYKVFSNPDECENIIYELLSSYRTECNQIILQLLQFFVDLCGYQDVSVQESYNFEEADAVNIITQVEVDVLHSDQKEAGLFLLMRQGGISFNAEQIISNFLVELILVSFKTEILFDEFFSSKIFEFVKCMSFSKIKTVRVTGATICLKFLSAILNLFSNLIKFINANVQNLNVDETNKRKEMLEKYIDFFYLICDKNCALVDDRCWLIKVKWSQEVFMWIQLFPVIFILKRRCMGSLMKLVDDSNEHVRKSALETCAKLVNFEEVYDQMKQRIQLCLKTASLRLMDFSYSVATQAIEVFTKAVNLYSEFIVKDYKTSIIGKLFQQNTSLAKAAARFLITFFHGHKKSDEWVLTSLTKIAFYKEEFTSRTSVFVEAFVGIAPELENFQLTFNLLSSQEVDLNVKKCLLKITHEVIRHYLTGEFSQKRNEIARPADAVEPYNHNEVASTILPGFQQLLMTFQSDKNATRQVIEILTFIDFGKCSNRLLPNYTETFELLVAIFKVSVDTQLLEMICCIFYNFCNRQTEFQEQANILFNNIKNSYCIALLQDLQKISPTIGEKFLIKLRENSFKVSVIFSKFDLTAVLKWNVIFLEWESTPFVKVLKYLFVCCKFHLIWRLRRVVSNPNGNNMDAELLLYHNCKEYVYSSIGMLNAERSYSLRFLVFENLFDMYANFFNLLRRQRRLQHLIVHLEDDHVQVMLINFAVQSIIENRELSLVVRRTYLSNVVDLFYLDVVSIVHASTILKYYHSHYDEFGVLMDHMFGELKALNLSLSCVIVDTLAESYLRLLDKNDPVNVATEGAVQLKLLAKRISLSKELKLNKEALKIVTMAINFAFSSERHYTFLYFARYFNKLLNEEWKSEAYDILKQKVPPKDKDNDIILFFAGGLKPKD